MPLPGTAAPKPAAAAAAVAAVATAGISVPVAALVAAFTAVAVGVARAPVAGAAAVAAGAETARPTETLHADKQTNKTDTEGLCEQLRPLALLVVHTHGVQWVLLLPSTKPASERSFLAAFV